MKSPIGQLTIGGEGDGVRFICFPNDRNEKKQTTGLREEPNCFAQARAELTEYFAGERTQFTFKTDPVGTEFQRQVWLALRQIGFGETTTYGEIAKKLGRPNAFRAVGAANGANPLPIVVPCHRVIGADGSLTGFSSGIDIKHKLLQLEGVVLL